jgi:hypothetical protein
MNTAQLPLLISATALLITILNLLFTKTFPWIAQRLSGSKLSSKLDGDLYAEDVIKESLKYYIKPFCQQYNPVGGDETEHPRKKSKPLFKEMKRLLDGPLKSRCIMILADSGMGKSTFLLNYYAVHLKKDNKYKIELLPLNVPDVDNRIKEIENKKNKVLFLDALDEDILAITDFKYTGVIPKFFVRFHFVSQK